MRFPWANTILLALIGVELVSGFFGLVSNSPGEAFFILAHRIAGWGIIVILAWKAVNVLASLRWPRSATPRTASIVLSIALVATLALGFVWSFIGPVSFWLFSGVSWHIYVGGALVPILIWHAIYHTRGFPLRFWADRRTFLRFAGLAVASVALWRAGEVAASAGGLSGASRRFTGSYEARSFSGNAFPLTSWFNDNPKPIDAEGWRLNIGGAVENPVSLRYEDISADTERTATLDCTGGWHSTQIWRGAALSDLLHKARPNEDSASVTIRSVTGYYRKFSMKEANGYMIATQVGDETLSHGHGFPARLVAHDKRGFEWVKWITDIEVNRTGKWLQPPLPLQ